MEVFILSLTQSEYLNLKMISMIFWIPALIGMFLCLHEKTKQKQIIFWVSVIFMTVSLGSWEYSDKVLNNYFQSVSNSGFILKAGFNFRLAKPLSGVILKETKTFQCEPAKTLKDCFQEVAKTL